MVNCKTAHPCVGVLVAPITARCVSEQTDIQGGFGRPSLRPLHRSPLVYHEAEYLHISCTCIWEVKSGTHPEGARCLSPAMCVPHRRWGTQSDQMCPVIGGYRR